MKKIPFLNRWICNPHLRALSPTRTFHARAQFLLALTLLGVVGHAVAAPHDLVLQHTGPSNLEVTATGTYRVNLSNTDPALTGVATGVALDFQFNTANAEFKGPARFTNGTGSCTEASAGTVSCTLNDIPYGVSNLQIEFDLFVNGQALPATYTSGVALNPVATVRSSEDRVPGNETESVNTTISAGTDLGVTLTSTPAGGGSLMNGGIWSHVVEVTNHGPLNTTGAKVTLVPPADGMVWANVPAGCTKVGINVECRIPGTLNNGATHSFSGLTAQAAAAAGSTLSLTASVSSDLTDKKADNNSANTSVQLDPGTDLAVTIGSTGGTILAGSPSTVTVTPTYTGEVPSNPVLTVTVPSALSVDTSVVPTSPLWGSCAWSGNTTLTCNGWVGTAAQPGHQQALGVVSFPVTGPTGTYPVSATIASATPEANIANNDAQTNVQFAAPTVDVSITKSGPTAPFTKYVKGSTIQYSVALQNPSSSNIAYWGPLSFVENPPAGLNITNIAKTGGGGNWTCTWTSAPVGCSATYTQADPMPVAAQVNFTVTAVVDSDTESALINNVCRPAFNHPLVGVEQPASCVNAGQVTGHASGTDLSIEKAGDATVKAGEWLTYEIKLGNTGTQAATNVVVSDTLDNLVTGVGTPAASFQLLAVPSGWTCKNGTTPLTQGGTLDVATVNLVCETPTFAVCVDPACPTVSFKVRPKGSNSNGGNQPRVNTAQIKSDTPEADFSNNTDRFTSTVEAKTDFSIAKVVSNGWDGSPAGSAPGKTGTELQYTITVTNAGGSSGANNVTVSDVLPENVTYLGITGSSSPACTGVAVNAVTTATNKTLTCTWSTFPASPAVRTFIVRIRPNNEWQGKTLTNHVYVNVEPGTTTPISGTTEESDYTNNTASADAAAGEADIDLQVAKRDTTDPVMVGADVDYEVTIGNNGPSVATNAHIYDYLPIKGFTWKGNLRFFQVNTDGTRGSEILLPEQTTRGMACSRSPALGASGAGGEDKTQPNKLNWLWPMNVTGATSPNPDYVNGQWDARIQSQADIICNMGNMQVAEKLMLVYTLHAEERGVYMNHAIVRSQEHIDRKHLGFADAVWNNDAIQHRTTVRTVPDVSLLKEVSQPTVSLQEPFTYTITVANKLTAEPAYWPQVRDSLPANMVLTGAPTLLTGASGMTGGAFACHAPPVAPDVLPAVGAASAAGDTAFICKLGTGIKPGAALQISVPVRVIGGGAGVLTNSATVHLDTDLQYDSEPPPTTDDSVPVNVVVSSIAGNVYHDANNDGVKDAGEAPINGVTITLTGTDSAGNSVNLTTTTTSGAYKFDNLAPGTYTVTETHPSAWVDGKDTVGVFGVTPGSGSAGDDVISNIVLPGDTHGTEYNFGELKPLPAGQTTASISGYVYHDINDDGLKQPAEAPIAGVTITLTGVNGDVRTTTTDNTGFYSFKGLEPGVEYTVTETQPVGWNDGKDTSGTVHTQVSTANDVFVVTTVDGGDGLQWNFGEHKPRSSVTGIPTLSQWGMILLSLLLAGFAARRMSIRQR